MTTRCAGPKRVSLARTIGIVVCAALALVVADCSHEPAPPRQRPAPSSRTSAVTTSETAVSAPPGPVAADRREVCDHAQEAFRSGTLGDAAQSRGTAAELQGMVDVADPGAARLLVPMLRATDAVAADGRAQARPALRAAENQAFDQLRRRCLAAGSTAWGG